MKNKIENLRGLFIEQGRELYDATKQTQKELPKIQSQSTNPYLKKIIDRQLNAAKNQRTLLQEGFNKLDENYEGESNECCQAIYQHSKKLLGRSPDPRVRDAIIINSIQRLNHSNITGLGAFTSYASELGYQDIANILHRSLDEEKAIDKELSSLAKEEVNREAEIGLML